MDYPIVFIPGLFGSLGDDVIPGTGEFTFGLAEIIYRPFIEILNSMGYIEGKNLFISYFDWKRPVLESVNKYLYPDIEKVKRKTNSKKVIIIGHSLGGLLGRAYASYYYPSNVAKLILIGAPNLGAVKAYEFWSGGRIPYPKIEDNILYNGLKHGFILYYKIFYNISHISPLRRMFPVARDLLPSYGYGDYLFWEEDNIRREIPIESMSVNNLFLNKLNEKDTNIENLYIISGTDCPTSRMYQVEWEDISQDKWKDGKPIKTYKTRQGDGTVTTASSLGNLGGNYKILEGNHMDILYKSQDYLSEILGKPISREIEMEEITNIEIILANNCHELEIITSDYNVISNGSIDIRDSRVKVIDLGSNNYWIMSVGDRSLQIKLNKEAGRGRKIKIYKESFVKTRI